MLTAFAFMFQCLAPNNILEKTIPSCLSLRLLRGARASRESSTRPRGGGQRRGWVTPLRMAAAVVKTSRRGSTPSARGGGGGRAGGGLPPWADSRIWLLEQTGLRGQPFGRNRKFKGSLHGQSGFVVICVQLIN